MKQGEKAFFSRRDLAELFGVTTQTVIRWELAGLLTSVHFASGSVRYSRAEVDRFIAAQTKTRPTKREVEAKAGAQPSITTGTAASAPVSSGSN